MRSGEAGRGRGHRGGALLLFGHADALARFLPSHEAAFQVLRGLEVEVNDFFRLPLLRLAELFARFRARNREGELDFGLVRVAVAAYSQTAFREALANALIHRDYTRPGAVLVQWSQDQLEIASPGGFPSGIRLDNLLVAPPHPRSPLLADAFKRRDWWSGPAAGSIACSPSSSAWVARRRTMDGVRRSMSLPCFPAAPPTWQ